MDDVLSKNMHTADIQGALGSAAALNISDKLGHAVTIQVQNIVLRTVKTKGFGDGPCLVATGGIMCAFPRTAAIKKEMATVAHKVGKGILSTVSGEGVSAGIDTAVFVKNPLLADTLYKP